MCECVCSMSISIEQSLKLKNSGIFLWNLALSSSKSSRLVAPKTNVVNKMLSFISFQSKITVHRWQTTMMCLSLWSPSSRPQHAHIQYEHVKKKHSGSVKFGSRFLSVKHLKHECERWYWEKYALHYLCCCCGSYPHSFIQVFASHKPSRAACCQQQVTNMQLLIQEEIVNFMAAVVKRWLECIT